METTQTTLFDRLTDEVNHLQQLDHVSGMQLNNLAGLVNAATISHQYAQGQLAKALERIADAPPDQYEDLYNVTLHLWINACADVERLEARCKDLETANDVLMDHFRQKNRIAGSNNSAFASRNTSH